MRKMTSGPKSRKQELPIRALERKAKKVKLWMVTLLLRNFLLYLRLLISPNILLITLLFLVLLKLSLKKVK